MAGASLRNARAPRMSLLPQQRRWRWLLAGTMAVLVVALLVKFWLGEYVVRTVLHLAGASNVQYRAVRGTPWHLEIEDLAFELRTQPFAAQRVVLDRPQWWRVALGAVRVEGARVAFAIDGTDANPWNWSTYEGVAPEDVVNLPFTSLDFDGQLVVRMAAMPDMPVNVKLAGQAKTGTSWIGNLDASGPGFRLAGVGSLLRAGQELEFQVLGSELDLAVWSAHLQRLMVLPGGPWEMGGRLTGVAEGRVTAKRFAATARVSLHGGHMKAGTVDVAAEGAEAELEFSDLWKYRTKSAQLRLDRLRIGKLALRGLQADFGLWGANTVNVQSVSATALGGRVTADPFRYELDRRELAITVRAEGIAPAELLALAPEIAQKPSGRIHGVLPMRLQSAGVRLDPGFLELEPAPDATLDVSAPVLLRSGTPLVPAALEVFKAAGMEPVRLKLQALRLELRTPGLPLGSSARLQVEGTAGDTPVAFGWNVNGAIERYLLVLP